MSYDPGYNSGKHHAPVESAAQDEIIEPCEECGLKPLFFTDEFGQTIRVDGCFRGLLGNVISACCGHGGRKPAYVRIHNGNDTVDICGGKVIDYGEFTRE